MKDLKTNDLKNFKRVLALYPHPDDETFSIAGSTHLFIKAGTEVYLFLATRGEEGRPESKSMEETRKKRTLEAKQSAESIGVTKLFHSDFGDGKLSDRRVKLRKYIVSLIKRLNPDLLITYDRSGMYGHPDHIALSDIATEVALEKKIRLWYSGLPSSVFEKLDLPFHMAKDKDFLKMRKEPNLKIAIGLDGMLRKIRSFNQHKSQHYTFQKRVKFGPLWGILLDRWYEYFYEGE